MGNLKRYNALFTVETLTRLKSAAKEDGITVIAMLRKFIKIGFLVREWEKEGNKIFIRDDQEEKEIFFL